MWISARTALTLAVAALLLVVVAVGAPLLPRPHLPPLPAVREAAKFGSATAVLEAPERVRTQAMLPSSQAPAGAARWAGRVGTGASVEPLTATVDRLRALLNGSRTVVDPHAEGAKPTWVVRFVRDDHRVDVMGDLSKDWIVIVEDERLVGAYSIGGLHREFVAVAAELTKERL